MPRVANQRSTSQDSSRPALLEKNMNRSKMANAIPTGRQLARTPVDKSDAVNIDSSHILPKGLVRDHEVEVRKRQNVIPSGKQLSRTPHGAQSVEPQTTTFSASKLSNVSAKGKENAIPTGRQLARTPSEVESPPLAKAVSNLVAVDLHAEEDRATSNVLNSRKQSLGDVDSDSTAVKNSGLTANNIRRRLDSSRKRKGTGRVTKKRGKDVPAQLQEPTPTCGSRTGFQLAKSVSRDDNGFEDINSFWGETPVSVPESSIAPASSGNHRAPEPNKLRLSILSNVAIDSDKLDDKTKLTPESPTTPPKSEELNLRAPSSVLKIASSLKISNKPVLPESLDKRNLIQRRRTETHEVHPDTANLEARNFERELSQGQEMETFASGLSPSNLAVNSRNHVESQDSKGPTQIIPRQNVEAGYAETPADDEGRDYDFEDDISVRDEPMITPRLEPSKIKRKVHTPGTVASTTSSTVSGGGSVCSDTSEEYQHDSADSEDDESLPAMTPKSSTRLSKASRSSRKRKAEAQRIDEEEDSLEQIGEKPLKKSLNSKAPTPGLRRSRRRKWNPLEHWKGERLLIVKGRDSTTGIEVPEVVAAAKPGVFKTPKPQRSMESRRGKPAKLPKGFHPDEPSTPVRCRVDDRIEEKVVVREAENMHISILPTAKKPVRINGRRFVPKAPTAGAAFDDDKFLSGIVQLPPLSTKPAEDTHGVEDKKYILSQGDHFWVPTLSRYSIENFSHNVEACVSFVLIKPT